MITIIKNDKFIIELHLNNINIKILTICISRLNPRSFEVVYFKLNPNTNRYETKKSKSEIIDFDILIKHNIIEIENNVIYLVNSCLVKLL